MSAPGIGFGRFDPHTKGNVDFKSLTAHWKRALGNLKVSDPCDCF